MRAARAWMAEPMDRSERIGRWVSGIGHVGILGWAAIGGALFGPQPAPPIQMTKVATMSEAQFEDFAAASRGAGPIQGEQQEVAALPQPAAEDVQSGALEPAAPPEPEAEAQPLPEPEAEDAPDLTDLSAAQAPVEVATALPQQELPRQPEEPDEAAPQPVTPPAPETATAQPEAPESPAVPDAAVQPPSVPEPPRSALALDDSPRPRGRPADLVENRNRRLAEQAAEARRQAEAAEAARQAEAERQAEAAEAEARARAEAEQARARDEAAARAADEARREEEARQAAADAAEAERLEQERLEAEEAEAERLADEAAERLRQEEDERLAAEAAERERQDREAAEAEQAEQDRLAAEQAERDRIAAEEAERALQDAAEAELAARDAEAAAEEARQRAEEASPDQDALAAALSEALGDPAAPGEPSGGATDGAPLSLSEREGFRLAINECWRVGSLSREAQGTSVTIAFSMSQNGMPEPGTMRLMGHSGGSPAAAQQAYEAAQRAVLQCAGTGYALPAEKYNRWKDVIIDFSPNGVGVN